MTIAPSHHVQQLRLATAASRIPTRPWGRGKRGVPSIYFRVQSSGKRSWFFNVGGKFSEALPSREAAIDGKAKAQLRRSAGMAPVDTRLRVSDLIAEVRETQTRNVRGSTLEVDERGLSILDAEVGHLRPGQLVGNDRLDRLVRDLIDGTITGRPLGVRSAKRYLAPLGAISKLAIRRGVIQVSLSDMVSWPREEERKRRFEWSRESISSLVEASRQLAAKGDARYDYSQLFELMVGTGLRIGEALALRKQDVDLLGGRLTVNSTLGRDGTLGSPKTAAGRRSVPLSDDLVSLLAAVIPADASETDFVFHAKGKPDRPLSYRNVVRRGFEPARYAAGLPATVTLHSLRSAAVSLFVEQGLSMVEVASVVGHSDSTVTARSYASLFEGDVVAAKGAGRTGVPEGRRMIPDHRLPPGAAHAASGAPTGGRHAERLNDAPTGPELEHTRQRKEVNHMAYFIRKEHGTYKGQKAVLTSSDGDGFETARLVLEDASVIQEESDGFEADVLFEEDWGGGGLRSLWVSRWAKGSNDWRPASLHETLDLVVEHGYNIGYLLGRFFEEHKDEIEEQQKEKPGQDGGVPQGIRGTLRPDVGALTPSSTPECRAPPITGAFLCGTRGNAVATRGRPDPSWSRSAERSEPHDQAD
jgi:integrase